MSIIKAAPFAALAFALLAASSQAQATQRHHYRHHAADEQIHTSNFDSTYRDPTTREALGEGAW
jgi:hypothetical protein